MDIINVSYCLQEIFKVVLLCKTCKLRAVVQSRVDDFSDAGFDQLTEELLRRGLSETDRINLNTVHVLLSPFPPVVHPVAAQPSQHKPCGHPEPRMRARSTRSDLYP